MWYRQYIYEFIAFFRKVLYEFVQRLPQQRFCVKCLICGWKGIKFKDYKLDFGRIYYNAECPVCLSHPRHRLVYLYFKQLVQKKKFHQILHCAPEHCLVKIFQSLQYVHYISIDYNSQRAKQRENLECLSFSSSRFDLIVCLCVLEHVKDDEKALFELYRVLKPGGICILDTPVDHSRKRTLEKPSIASPEDRAKYYWQKDHNRLYGKDFPSRVRKAGFLVRAITPKSLGTNQYELYGLPTNPLYVATKH